jgi:hypothetical protein
VRVSLLLFVVSVGASAFAADPVLRSTTVPLTVSSGATSLTVSGATASGSVTLLGIDREPNLYFFNYSHYSDLQPANGSGTATFDITNGVAAYSAWIVVDLSTGRIGTLAPAGSPFQPTTIPVQHAGDSTVTISGKALDFALVRPGSGVWSGPGGNGPHDNLPPFAQQPGTIDLSGGLLQPLGSSLTAPTTLAAHDLIIGIDAGTLQYFTSEVQP